MTLMIDRSSGPTAFDDQTLRAWASGQTVFLSSEMGGLRDERRAIADALRELGFSVVMFEDFGGRDDDAETAYLDGVARSDIYIGLVGRRYGTMLRSGRSPTHEEYREARRRGLRIAVWVAADGSARQGDARDYVTEVRVFHTTGSWNRSSELVASVVARMREMAAEQDSPWVKLGDITFRAASIVDDGRRLTLQMHSRDRAVLSALEAMRPNGPGRSDTVSVTTADRSGTARVTEVTSRASSSQRRELAIAAEVDWAEGRRSTLASGLNGVSVEEQVEIGLRAGLFGEPLPEQLGMLSTMLDADDPLAPLDGLGLPQSTYESVARLLIVERLIGSQGASYLEHFAVGPEHDGARSVELAWRDALYYSNVEPASREIRGTRCSVGSLGAAR